MAFAFRFPEMSKTSFFSLVFVLNSCGGTFRPVDCTSASWVGITQLPSISRCSAVSCYASLPKLSDLDFARCLINGFCCLFGERP